MDYDGDSAELKENMEGITTTSVETAAKTEVEREQNVTPGQTDECSLILR